MTLITQQTDLEKFCRGIAAHDKVFLDTEFLRETTYYPLLCVIQAKLPGEDPVAIDALSDLDLTPLWEQLDTPKTVKVFHAGRQDLEIIMQATGALPTPLFDTQIAASVLGFGEQVGFESLVRSVLRHQLDKGSQFTDWSRRPLSDRQIKYALDDVRYLEPIHHNLSTLLDEQKRYDWVAEDLAILHDPKTYQVVPEEVWRRIKMKSDKPRDLAVLRALAAWREREAQRRNVPRNRVIKDELLAEIAQNHPRSPEELSHIRNIDKGMARGKAGQEILTAITQAMSLPDSECPVAPRKRPLTDDQEQLLDVLKLIVKIRARELGIAPRLLASSDDLDHLVRAGLKDSKLALGWRYDMLGQSLEKKTNFQFTLDMAQKTVSLRQE